jgi:hypothetical protein
MKAKYLYLFLYIFIGAAIICTSWLTNDLQNRLLVQMFGLVYFVGAAIFAAKIIIKQNN